MNEIAGIFITPRDERDWAVIGHLRGWCHNGAVCAICKAQHEAFRAERDLDRIISG